MGDARGHLSRALAIAQELPHHEFLFIGGGKVQILKERGYRVEEVPMISTNVRNNRVDFLATLAHDLISMVRLGPAIKKVMGIIKGYDPHLIISDYEFITPRAAKLMGRPCVSLGNEHLFTQCVYDPPPGQRLSRNLTCLSVRHLFSAASHFLIPSFHPLPPVDRTRTEVFPPLIKPKVLEYQPTPGEHGLIYLRGYNYDKLIKLLGGKNRKFIIYGLGDRPPQGNLIFKKTTENNFLADLASCLYVITHGGHSLISEALYLGKPILCHPVHFLYEQFFNAHFLTQCGFGHYFWDNSRPENLIESFEDCLGQYQTKIKQHNFLGNKQIIARIKELMRSPGLSSGQGNKLTT
jgi:uncharacterized protein (TIGR00661 family)